MSETENKKPSKSNIFFARLFSTLLLWGAVAGVFLSGSSWLFVIFASFLSMLGSWEFFQMTKRGKLPAMRKWGLLISAAYLLVIGYLLGSRGHEALIFLLEIDVVFVILVVLGGLSLQLRRAVDGKNTILEVAVTTVGFVFPVLLFSFLCRLWFLPDQGSSLPGAWLVIWLIAVTKFSDMGAYITGSLIGKHKMIPHISPGKTWQGFFGALVFSLLAGCGLYALVGSDLAILKSWTYVIALSLALSLLAVVGDLGESVIKRSMGVKDSGNTLPGIGGTLDLIDSLCFTAPFLYFSLRLIN